MSILRNLSFKRRQGRGAPSSHVPNYYINLINEIEESDKRKLAIFLDKDSSTTSLLVFLYCVNHLSKRFPKYMKEFAEKRWQLGDRVKVLPGNHVFEYAGILERDTSFLWLKLLDKEDRRTLPIKEIARLEKTESKRPKGTFKTPFPDQDRSPQDMVLGPDVATYGNLDIYPNIAFLLGKSSQLKVAFDSLQVKEKTFPRYFFLSEVYPFGSLNSFGEILSSDRHQTEQSPVVALSASYENIFLASDNFLQERAIFIDGYERILDKHNYNFPQESKQVLFLSKKDLQYIEDIKKRGFSVHIVSDEEILEREENPNSVFYKPFSGALTRSNLNIEFVDVHSKAMNKLYSSLIKIADAIDNSFYNENIDQLFLRSLGLFYDFSESCFNISKNLKDKLHLLEENFKSLNLEGELDKTSLALIKSFEDVIEDFQNTKNPKGIKLLEKIKEFEKEDSKTWKILSRNIVSGHYPNDQFLTLDTKDPFDKALIVGWPNKKRFQKFWFNFLSSNLIFFCYPHERSLFMSYLSQQEAFLKSLSSKNNIEGMNAYLSKALEEHKGQSRKKFQALNLKDNSDKIIRRIEDRLAIIDDDELEESLQSENRVDCKLAIFSEGEAYSWVTENHGFYVLDEIIEGREELSVPFKKLTEVEPGNFLLFREKGDKEIISLIVEQSVGSERYLDLVNQSSEWKWSIKSLGSISETFNKLKENGLDRSRATVAAWMRGGIICPEKRSDLEIINTSVKQEFKFDIDECFKAAETRRSLRISAGTEITRQILIQLKNNPPNLDSGLNKLNLDFGEAWIAELDTVKEENRIKSISEVNHLIFSEI